MAKLNLQSKYKLKSEYEIPVLGYGVSTHFCSLEFHARMDANLKIGLANVRWLLIDRIIILLTQI